MKIKTSFLRLALSSLALLSLSQCAIQNVVMAEASFAEPQAGKPAPGFSLKNIDGKTVSLSDFQGKYVVIEWFDDKCPFDHKHYDSGNMQKLQKDYAKKGVVWLLVNSAGEGKPGFHSNDEYKQIAKTWKFETPYFLQDPDGKVGHQYGAKTTPDMFVVSKEGKLLYSGAIDDHADADEDSIKVSKNYVKAALDEAMSGKAVTTTTTKSYG